MIVLLVFKKLAKLLSNCQAVGRLYEIIRSAILSESYTIKVAGRPAPQGSKRHVGGGRFIEASKYLRPWRTAVSTAARRLTPDGWHTNMGVSLTITFILARPKSHFRSNGKLKDTAPRLCLGRIGDLDKLVRAVFDALTGIAYDDDSQVFDLHTERRYAIGYEKTGAIITVTAIND